MKFKIGDKVICIESRLGVPFTVGNTYIVSECDGRVTYIDKDDAGNRNAWYHHMFKKALRERPLPSWW